MILAIETSTELCSVAIEDASGAQQEKRVTGRSVHSDHLFLFIQEMMKEHTFSINDLSAVIVSNGPGSYTGLRIAASAVKGLLFGEPLPLYSANTLAAFAAGVPGNGRVHAIIDARRTHLYHQVFDKSDQLKAISDCEILEIDAFQNQLKPGDYLIGTGIERLSEQTLSNHQCFGMDYLSAKNLIELYHMKPSSALLKRTITEELNPEYISMSQVNNSKL